jgi:hypothetical protein
VELVEGKKESISPKVAAAGAIRVGRRCQAAAAAAIRVVRVRIEGERREAEAGLGRFDRPRTWPVRLDQPGWLGQANGPRPIYKSKFVFKI